MKPYLIALALLLAAMASSGQQNAPVAGQASILYDLLKKDYSSIDPDLVGDQLVADRAQVISILRSFQRPLHHTFDSTAVVFTQALKDAKGAAEDYNAAKKVANSAAITTVSTTEPNVMNAAATSNSKKVTDLETARQLYYGLRYAADDLLLQQVQQNYKDEGNQFIWDVTALFIAKYEATEDGTVDNLATVNPNASVNKAAPVFGEFGNTSQIIAALGNITFKRMKAELMTFAVQIIQDWLNAHSKTTPTEELITLFPATFNKIMNFDADRLANFPNDIRGSIVEDLNKLMDNGYRLKNTTLFQQLIKNQPDLELAFEAFHLIPQLTKVKSPSDFLSVVNSSSFVAVLKARTNPDGSLNELSTNVVQSLAFMELMSNSLTMTNNGDAQYTTVDFWAHYGKELPFMKLYIGLLRQQNVKYYNVKFLLPSGDFVLETSLKTLVNVVDNVLIPKVNTLQPILTDITKNAQSIYMQAQNMKKLNNGSQKIGADTIFSFNKSVIDFARDLGTDADKVIAVFEPAKTPEIAKKIGPFIMVADSANDALKNIYDKNYAAGIVGLLQTALAIVPNGQLQQVVDYSKFYTLSKLNPTVWADWSALSSLLRSGGAASGAQMAASAKVSTELGYIKAYYTPQTGAKQKVTDLIQSAQKLLHPLATSANLDTGSISKLNVIWKDPRFQAAVVSYYAKFQVLHDAGELADKMKLPVSDGKGGLAAPLTGVDIKLFGQNIQSYITLVFTTHISQETIDPDILKNVEDGIGTVIVQYATQLSGLSGHKFDQRVSSLISFIADMAAAKDSSAVESAIEKLILPAGSYSIKQKSIYTLTVNAFPGFIGGWEVTNTKSPATTIGFTAPIGLNMTWGRVYKSWTLGFFVPLIDVGAVTRLRLDNDSSTGDLPELTWKNIFSPGLFLTVGIGKTPFSINLGVQYGPEVKDLNAGKTLSSWRIGAGLTVDIPFFNIYNKPFGN